MPCKRRAEKRQNAGSLKVVMKYQPAGKKESRKPNKETSEL
jgi:hypothetical protein